MISRSVYPFIDRGLYDVNVNFKIRLWQVRQVFVYHYDFFFFHTAFRKTIVIQ